MYIIKMESLINKRITLSVGNIHEVMDLSIPYNLVNYIDEFSRLIRYKLRLLTPKLTRYINEKRLEYNYFNEPSITSNNLSDYAFFQKNIGYSMNNHTISLYFYNKFDPKGRGHLEIIYRGLDKPLRFKEYK